MSDLQIGLIGLGILLIVLVVSFNWWQDRRLRRRMRAHFPGSAHDPLLAADEGLTEPHVTAQPVAALAATQDGDDADEADPLCEVVIEIAFAQPVSGAELLPHVQELSRTGRKAVRLFAQTVERRHRALLYPQESYVSLQLAVLLANRSGALTAIEWSQIWRRAQEFAEQFEAVVEGPNQHAVLEQAARLDETCAALDAQVGLTLVLNSPLSAKEVIAVARDLGFIADGQYLVWLTDLGEPRFTLSRTDGTGFDEGIGSVDHLALLLDVPCSPPDPQAFSHMVGVARELAARLGAELIDDQGKPLAAGAETIVDVRLRTLFAQLEQAGFMAGSARAKRVFA